MILRKNNLSILLIPWLVLLNLYVTLATDNQENETTANGAMNQSEQQTNDKEKHEEIKEIDLTYVEEILAEEFEFQDFGKRSVAFQECRRYSVEELYHSEVLPLLEASLDETLQFTSALIGSISGGVSDLEKSTSNSPLGKHDNPEEIFDMIQNFAVKNLKRAGWMILQAWATFIEENNTLMAKADVTEPETLFEYLHSLIEELKDTHENSQNIMIAVLQELSVNVKTIIMNGVKVVKDDLENSSEDTDTAPSGVMDRIPKVAPNFYGIVMKKILERGLDTSKYKKIKTEVLRKSFKSIKQMESDVEEIIEKLKISSEEYKNKGTRELLIKFWKNNVLESQKRLKRRPLSIDDFEKLYSNLEFLSETTLSLMATW